MDLLAPLSIVVREERAILRLVGLANFLWGWHECILQKTRAGVASGVVMIIVDLRAVKAHKISPADGRAYVHLGNKDSNLD